MRRGNLPRGEKEKGSIRSKKSALRVGEPARRSLGGCGSAAARGDRWAGVGALPLPGHWWRRRRDSVTARRPRDLKMAAIAVVRLGAGEEAEPGLLKHELKLARPSEKLLFHLFSRHACFGAHRGPTRAYWMTAS